MHPINNNYSFCPTCGNRIYNYETTCSACSTVKVDFDELQLENPVTVCKKCSCGLRDEFAFCPSCGTDIGKDNKLASTDYEATNVFLKIGRQCLAAFFAIFFAINAIWCSIFGIFYGAMGIICSIGSIAFQIWHNKNKKSNYSKYSYIFIVIAAILIIVALIVLVVAAFARAEIADGISALLF